MSDESLEQVECHIASMCVIGSPIELRAAVLSNVRRELRAACWDRRMARAATVLFALGIGLNAAIGQPDGSGSGNVLRARPSETQLSLVDTAIAVAQATDGPTGEQVVRQLAAMTGRELTADEAVAIETALRRPTSRKTPKKRG